MNIILLFNPNRLEENMVLLEPFQAVGPFCMELALFINYFFPRIFLSRLQSIRVIITKANNLIHLLIKFIQKTGPVR